MVLKTSIVIIFVLSYLNRYRYNPVVLPPGTPGWHKWARVGLRFTGNSIRVSLKLFLLLVGVILLVGSLGALNFFPTYEQRTYYR